MNEKYKIGEKLRRRRNELGLTQTEVAGDIITRNMLSLIEAGKATPSLEVLDKIAAALDMPLSYLFSHSEDAPDTQSYDRLSFAKKFFVKKDYSACIDAISKADNADDELNYILAYSFFYKGRELLFAGSLTSATEHLERALSLANSSPYVVNEIVALSKLYLAVAKNIQSPLLELDAESFVCEAAAIIDLDFFKYVVRDDGYDYRCDTYRKHLDARGFIKRYAYNDAITLLLQIEAEKNTNYNAYVMFGVYSDLESCFKQIGDFENAYRYSTKRFSLLSAFNT